MTGDLEELEKQFILNEDMEHEDVKTLVSRILKFCKIDNRGFVIVHGKQLRILDRILLVLSARYLANKLQSKLGKEVSIQETVSTKELANMLKEKDAVIRARLSDLSNEKKIIPQDRGVFKVASYAINPFLTELEGAKNG